MHAAIVQAMPVLSVHLSRFGNEKLGLCLRSEGSYATITGWELMCGSDALESCSESGTFRRLCCDMICCDNIWLAGYIVCVLVPHQRPVCLHMPGIGDGEFESWV